MLLVGPVIVHDNLTCGTAIVDYLRVVKPLMETPSSRGRVGLRTVTTGIGFGVFVGTLVIA